MRQFADTLIWLGLMLVATAVVYYTPRFATYMTPSDTDFINVSVTSRPIATHAQPIASHHTFHSVVDLPH
jgi:hypothetical protein